MYGLLTNDLDNLGLHVNSCRIFFSGSFKKMNRPRPRSRQQFLYKEIDMKRAVEAVIGGKSALSASKQFNVPRSTLVNKVMGKSPIKGKMGPAPLFGQKGELMLVNWIK